MVKISLCQNNNNAQKVDQLAMGGGRGDWREVVGKGGGTHGKLGRVHIFGLKVAHKESINRILAPLGYIFLLIT